ncbi:hypothetical protein OnM2_064053 [Erysiphe neolycopersici]|uniref:Uncharacterized protein n=1 Tax=Erysiphe neolycopersici TaxID=212602 RepID=A0A420HNC4_9PEZI|nr:hypothetical protein OnM2_064053 [Erysiphe neolycopersici]
MFANARHEAQRCVRSAQFADKFDVTLSPRFLPSKYSIAAIASEALPIGLPEDLQKKHEIILLINTCLSQNERLSRKPAAALHFDDARVDDGIDELSAIRSIMLSVSKIIRPNGNLFISDQLTDAQKQTALGRIRHIGELGLSSLLCLHSLFPEDHEKKLDEHIIFSLLAFSSISDPWTTQTSLDLANGLLSVCRVEILGQEFITKSVLSSFIRPLFSASKPKAITTSGYAAIPSYTPREPQDFSAWDLASKPWRLDTCYALSVLSWVVNHASVSIPPNHTDMPPILILLDSPNTEMQLKGLKLHNTFVPRLTPKLLEQTGLGAVIEDAIHPIMLYLPPITPKNECLSLLPVAFESFFILLEVRFPSSTISDISNQDQAKQKQKLTSLTRLLRQAIAPAYNHTSISSESDPIIKKIILDQIPPLVRALGIHSVVHLQTLIKLTEEPLLDPFATASLPTMLAALKALREIILCAWPRLSEERRRREVIRMMVSAWRKVCNESNNSTEALRKEVLGELKISGRLFVKAVETSNEIDLSCDLNSLVEVDKSLKELFGT